MGHNENSNIFVKDSGSRGYISHVGEFNFIGERNVI